MIPKRMAPFIIALILSGCMSFLVTCLATFRAVGLPPGFVGIWMSAWVFSWMVAFPTLFLLRPIVTRLVMRMTDDGRSKPS